MQTLHATGTTAADGTLSLHLPVGRPGTTFDVVVVVSPKPPADPAAPPADPWAATRAIFNELAASGRVFSDSVPDIREDRDR